MVKTKQCHMSLDGIHVSDKLKSKDAVESLQWTFNESTLKIWGKGEESN